MHLTPMDDCNLTNGEVLAGYDALSPLYGHVAPLILWRAWEYAAYRRYSLVEPVLDVGCGDGLFFRTAFPSIRSVMGIDSEAMIARHATHSGVYRAVAVAQAHALPFRAGAFATAFANCSLEHMDRLDEVLQEVWRALRPDGWFLLSVVTDRLVSWAPLARLLRVAGAGETGGMIQKLYEDYHHLVNALPVTEWRDRLRGAGFHIVQENPIAGGAAGQVFLLLDQLWHTQHDGDELGIRMLEWMRRTPRSVLGVRQILAGLLEMRATSDEHAGVVLMAQKR
jgi:SAM-dependent methyltransferase